MDNDSKLKLEVKAKTNYKAKIIANFIELLIPVPKESNKIISKCRKGTCKYNPEKDALQWNIKSLPGKREISMTCELNKSNLVSKDNFKNRPIIVNFEIPYYTLSGINVRFLKIKEKSYYNSMSWVRFIVRNGEYIIRKNNS